MSIGNSIIIVNHGRKDALRAMLHALKLDEALSTEVIVVDNASFDGGVEMVMEEFPQALLIRRETNTGFAAAVNQGIDQSQGDVVILCHGEIIASAHVLSELADRVREGESRKVAAIVPRVVNLAGEDCAVAGKFPGLLAGIRGAFNPLAARKTFVPFLEHATDDEWGLMACIAINREVFDLIGGLDERFFLYGHDADFSHRLHAKLHRLLFDHDLKVIDASDHPDAPPPHLMRILRKDQAKYFEKYAPAWQRGIINAALWLRGKLGKEQ